LKDGKSNNKRFEKLTYSIAGTHLKYSQCVILEYCFRNIFLNLLSIINCYNLQYNCIGTIILLLYNYIRWIILKSTVRDVSMLDSSIHYNM